MSRRHARWLARTLWVVTVVLAACTLLLGYLTRNESSDQGLYVFFPLSAVAFGTVGALVASRRGSVLGWAFALVGLGFALGTFAESYVLYALVTSPGSLPVSRFLTLLTVSWFVATTALCFVFLLFPDGQVPSRRWRFMPKAIFGSAALLALGATFAEPLLTGPWTDHGVEIANPFYLDALRIPALGSLVAGGTALLVCGIASAVSLVLRFRRSTGEERQQIRWVAYVVVLALVGFVSVFVVGFLGNAAADAAWAVFSLTLTFGLPVAAGIAIFKYHLYDLDLVLKKTVVFALVAAFITAIYALVVIAVPALVVGFGTGTGFSPLTLLTTVVVALLFQPVRNRARRLADRVVYGKRATPYEVLSEFSDRLADTYSVDDVMPRMAQLVATGTGATAARIWLRVGAELVPSASWPVEEAADPLPMTGDALPEFGPRTSAFPVRHQGDLLGAITVVMPANDPMNPSKEKLVQDVTGQAGLVLRNVRLIEELRASRRRIVAAQDERAKKLERDLHDGAQQQLVALTVKLRLAEQLGEREPGRATQILGEIRNDAADALENLRDLARGIYPPLLADRGLPEALEAQARKAAVPTTVESDGVDRYPQEVETAVYFCALEALNNTAKYSNASRATIRLTAANGDLSFEVADDGRGFDPETATRGTGLQGMADRVEAIGGSLEVVSAPGRGTTIAGTVPLG